LTTSVLPSVSSIKTPALSPSTTDTSNVAGATLP
jgi:hypothetical protein